jgi:hypothetical protein
VPGQGQLVTRRVPRKLRELKLLEVNARYMPAPEFNQLVENLKRDGVLTSTPLIHEDIVVSGNHRVQAALKAGIEEADVIEVLGVRGAGEDIVERITHERLVAMQLSHNALNGKDDPSLLKLLYEELPMQEKSYSGITDDMLNADALDLASLSAGGVQYQEVMLSFLPNEASEFTELMDRIQQLGARGRRMLVFAGLAEDWEKTFNAVISVKENLNVRNTAIAFRIMAELAVEKLEELAGKE